MKRMSVRHPFAGSFACIQMLMRNFVYIQVIFSLVREDLQTGTANNGALYIDLTGV